MASLEELRKVLRSRVGLKAPDEESDAVYKIPDEVLDEVLKNAAMAHNPSFTDITKVPEEQIPFVLILAEIEVYYALAAGNARFFSISAEGAQINKQERVNHYMMLIQGRQQHYDMLWAKFKESNPNQIEAGEVIVRAPNLLNRAWRLTDRPSISLVVNKVRSDSVDISWDVSRKTKTRVNIYLHTDLIIDEWEIPIWADGVHIPISSKARLVWYSYNPFLNKFRIKGLKPNADYNIAAVVIDTLGKWNFSEITVTTLPVQ